MSSGISGDLAGERLLLLESMGRAMEAGLFPGQRLSARVIEMLLTGDVLVELGKTRVAVPTSTPLQPGDRVRLEVVTAGPTPELRIVPDKTADKAAVKTAEKTAEKTADRTTDKPAEMSADKIADKTVATIAARITDKAAATPQPATAQPQPPPQAQTHTQAQTQPQPPAGAGQPAALTPRDLPVIMRALAEMPPAGMPIAQAAQTFLRAAAAADLRPAVVEQMQRLLAPLHAALPPAELAPMLRAFLAQSGLFTENHLGAALKEHPGPITTDQRQPIADVRLLLGALTPPGTPAPEPVRVFGEALLQQQLVVAEQVAATGGGQVDLPFMFGEERVDIRFTWDREARHETQERPEPDDDGDGAISLGVFVNLQIFGAIEARIVWKPESFNVTFYVERDATRAIVEAGLSELSKELSASGFSAVATNVWLNPDRVAAGVTPVRRAIPAGTILDVMA